MSSEAIQPSPEVPRMPAVSELEAITGGSWNAIHAAAESASQMTSRLSQSLGPFTSKDVSMVVVGSLARQEVTENSDIDWMLLVDGLSDPNHVETVQQIQGKITEITGKVVGPEGYFAIFVSSHDLVQNIGGQNDTNANTTRRMLLLLESIAIGTEDAHKRVFRNVLSRYLQEDRGLWYGSSQFKVPRFLFNDIARYWRTMAVDFPYKQRTRPGGDFALKNFKLRMSRKLIFLAGMIACFECHLSFGSAEDRTYFYKTNRLAELINRVEIVLRKPPLEIVASALLREPRLNEHSKAFFDAYNEFLVMLGDEDIRDQLKKLKPNDLNKPIADRYRQVTHHYMDAIREIFLQPTNELGRLTIEFGVF